MFLLIISINNFQLIFEVVLLIEEKKRKTICIKNNKMRSKHTVLYNILYNYYVYTI